MASEEKSAGCYLLPSRFPIFQYTLVYLPTKSPLRCSCSPIWILNHLFIPPPNIPFQPLGTFYKFLYFSSMLHCNPYQFPLRISYKILRLTKVSAKPPPPLIWIPKIPIPNLGHFRHHNHWLNNYSVSSSVTLPRTNKHPNSFFIILFPSPSCPSLCSLLISH